MEVISPKDNNFTDVYQSGDVFKDLSNDKFYMLTTSSSVWDLVSLDGDDIYNYMYYGRHLGSVNDWVHDCLVEYVYYPKSDYQLILHKKDMG